MTTLGIDPGAVRLVAQRLNHYATAGPEYIGTILSPYFKTLCRWTDDGRMAETCRRIEIKDSFIF